MKLKKLKFFVNSLIGFVGTKNLENRQAWVQKSLLNIAEGSSILDAGAGEQQYKIHCKHLVYLSQDFNQYEGEGNNAGIQTGSWDTSKTDIVSDIVKIPIEDSKFDAILCTEVFEHIPDPIEALNEFYRLLKPGGELIISAPFCSLTHFAPYHFYSGFNKYFYEHHLLKIGFKIVEISQNGDYSDYLAQELRRLENIFGKAPVYIRVCIAIILRFINLKQLKHDTSELCCFGFHVRAIKY